MLVLVVLIDMMYMEGMMHIQPFKSIPISNLVEFMILSERILLTLLLLY